MKYIRIFYFCLVFVLASVLLLPFFILRPFHPGNSSLFLKLLNAVLAPVMGIQYKIIDQHKYYKNLPAIAVGNHQHNWDFLMAAQAFNSKTVFLGKSQLAFIPVFGQIFWLGGNISVNRSNSRKALRSMIKVESILKKYKVGVVIFPEGHRNPSSTLLPFKKGAFRTAILAQVPIVPFSVNLYCKELDLNKRNSGVIRVQFHDPIPTTGLTAEDLPQLMEQCRQVIEQAI